LLSGYASDKAPSIDKALYQGLDSRLPGSQWWSTPASSGTVLSGMQWQWDIYSGRHHELMNDNPDKVLTETDAWNGEDFSSVALTDDGTAYLRQDARLLDRIYPAAVAGRTLAFTYEDRSRDGSTPMAWIPVPSSLPNTQATVANSRYGVLVWRSGGDGSPTELQLPADFANTVVSDVSYTIESRKLVLSGAGAAGVLHFALVADSTSASASVRAAAKTELAAWAAAAFPNSYRLVNRATGKCLDVYNWSTADAGEVLQWTCGNGNNQRWQVESLGDGTSRLINTNSGKVLDVAGCGTADGTNIQQYTWWNNNCQRWQLVDTDSGWVRLLNPNSGKVADVADCNSADGTDVRLWTWLNNDCQQFSLQP
jgi:hypothetical protein